MYLYMVLARRHWSTESRFGLLSTRKSLTYWRESEPSVGSPSWSGAWSTRCAEKGDGVTSAQHRGERARECLTDVCSCLKGGWREDRASVSLEVQRDSERQQTRVKTKSRTYDALGTLHCVLIQLKASWEWEIMMPGDIP